MSALVPSSDEHASQAITVSRPRRLDDTAFAVLFRECVADVHAYLISLLGDRSAAEDVTALAFERLYRSRSRLDHGRGTPRAWLFAIARNAALDELRRRRRQPQCELDADQFGARDTTDALEHIERRATVREAVSAVDRKSTP